MTRQLSIAFSVLLMVGLVACSDSDPEPSIPAVCTDGDVRCGDGDNIAGTCVGGQWKSQACGDEAICVAGVCEACQFPGERVCGGSDRDESWVCLPEQAPGLNKVCDDSEFCTSGVCLSLCSPDLKSQTNVGCEYYAVDLENSDTTIDSFSAENADFAVILSNPASDKPVTVTVRDGPGKPALAGHVYEVAPGELVVAALPPKNLRGTMVGPLAYFLEGNRPFIAYQFNPLDNVNPVFSNDASLLLPNSTAGREFYAMTGQNQGFVTVVAVYDDTMVTVTPSSETLAGDGVPALAAKANHTLALAAGDVFNLRSAGGGLSGTHVTAITVPRAMVCFR